MTSLASGRAAGVAAGVQWSLLFGNFVIGFGVMSVAGTLPDLARSLDVSVAVAGQLIAIAAAVMCFGAPLLAGVVAGWDRRRLLVLALLWYAIGHALSALIDSYALLLVVRTITMLAAAVFTPQAAAAVNTIAPPAERGRALTFVLLGWSLASVLGMPMAAWLGGYFGWQAAFGLVAVLAFVAAGWVHASLPDGIRPPAMPLRAWGLIFTHRGLMAVIASTALLGAGQFTLFSYLAPFYRDALALDAGWTSLLFGWFGAFGLLGNLLLTHHIDRIGAPRAATWLMGFVMLSLLCWPLVGNPWTAALVMVPWALGAFAANSAQQARLAMAMPVLAPALMALNTSAIYLGQSIGAGGGGWLITRTGYAALNWVGAAWVAVAIGLSFWAARRPVDAGLDPVGQAER